MANQPDLLNEDYEALRCAEQLKDMLADDGAWDDDDFPDDAIREFILWVKDFYEAAPTTLDYILVVGFGQLKTCLIWTMKDTSILIVGYQTETSIGIGSLPPGSDFKPVTATPDGIPTFH